MTDKFQEAFLEGITALIEWTDKVDSSTEIMGLASVWIFSHQMRGRMDLGQSLALKIQRSSRKKAQKENR